MPDTSTIFAKILCPQCGVHLLNSMRCSWGEVPGQEYKVGDNVKWLYDKSGNLVKPFELRKLGPNMWRWNCGSPSFQNVFVFDEDVYAGNHRLSCPSCGAKICACVAIVRNDIFQDVLALQSLGVDQILGRSRGRANVALDNLDGTYSPREDWFDCPIEYNKEDL